MTIELLLLVCLPLMGFNGSPLSYSSIFDTECALHRELAMKILRVLDGKRACNDLVAVEEKIAQHLDLPQFNVHNSEEAIELHELCLSLKNQEVEKSATPLEWILSAHHNQCWLEKVHVPSHGRHRHAVIAIAGFMQ